MSRKVGSFTDPKTGENHWLEPDTVKDYPLPKHRINMLGDSGYKDVLLQLESNASKKTIELSSSVEIDGKTIRSQKKAEMDELAFAEELFNAYVADETFASREKIVAYQSESVNELRQELLKAGKISDGLNIQIFGEVKYDNDLVAVFDRANITVGFGSVDALTLQTDSLVSNIVLNLEKKPTVLISAYGKEFSFNVEELEQTTPGIVSSYTFKLKYHTTHESEKEPLSPLPKDVATDSPEYLSRIAMLSSDDIEEENIDDRFEDIFDL